METHFDLTVNHSYDQSKNPEIYHDIHIQNKSLKKLKIIQVIHEELENSSIGFFSTLRPLKKPTLL